MTPPGSRDPVSHSQCLTDLPTLEPGFREGRREEPPAHPFQHWLHKHLTSFLYIVKEAFKVQLPLINTV